MLSLGIQLEHCTSVGLCGYNDLEWHQYVRESVDKDGGEVRLSITHVRDRSMLTLACTARSQLVVRGFIHFLA
jgi:hypothetical protein